jgi:methanogenic corrinoid protein MtbC1
MTDSLTSQLRDALEAIDRPRVEAIFQQALQVQQPTQVVEALIAPVLEQLGQDWSAGTIALSQIYMSSRICEDLVDRLIPASALEQGGQPRMAIVVLHEYHLLGKRIVMAIMRASGFRVIDYGHMEEEALVDRVLADQLEVLLVSVLMLPSALRVKALRAALDARGWRGRIVVGGAPFRFDAQLWREVGADAMGCSGADAVTIVRRWMEERP